VADTGKTGRGSGSGFGYGLAADSVKAGGSRGVRYGVTVNLGREGVAADPGRGQRRSQEGKLAADPGRERLGWEGGGLRMVWRGG